MICIVTDSTCDVPAALLAGHRVVVVPVNVQFGHASYQEGITLTAAGFYQMVVAQNLIPTSSQPSIGQFQAAYRLLQEDPNTEAILSIHLTGNLSGTYESAVIAAGQMPEEPPITVFDSLSGSMGLGFMVLEAAEMARKGTSLPVILARLEALRERMLIFLSVDDLKYARMSGRVGAAQALMASLLNIKPMLTVSEGRFALVGRVRNRTQALRTLADTLCDQLGDRPARVAVIHAHAPEAAVQVRAMLAQRVSVSQIIVSELSLGIAVHLGPGTVGVVGYNL
jgi:DegV family protein with EDD domain